MCILSLLCNVVTLALSVATLQRRDVAMSRRQFYRPLECRDVRFQRQDVDFELLWNVATLISNVATLILNSSGTSRRWKNFLSGMSRRWKISSLERRDVAPNVTTLSCLRPKTPHFFASTLPSSYLNPSVLCHAPTQPLPESTSSPVGGHSFSL